MDTTQVKIDTVLHNKMKELAGPERGAIANEYRNAIKRYIEIKTQENKIDNTGLENYINIRVSKAEDHLASMLGRTGMDVSMVLIGILQILEALYKKEGITKKDIFEKLRKDGATYFTSAIKKDKENPNENRKG